MSYRDHQFLGITQSLCPDCMSVVQAKIVARNGKVYFQKYCEAHGRREDFVCSDVAWFDRGEFSLPGKLPVNFGTTQHRGCPYDCGLCSEHEQHTCIGLLEITSHCNLECPICFAGSGPGGKHLTLAECQAAIDTLVDAEGQPEVLQLSGGEPTIHPDFPDVLRYACDQPIDVVMINTNGVRIARDRAFFEQLERFKSRLEVYFQFDSFDESQTDRLRGQSLVSTKLQAIERLGTAGIRTTLVCTVQRGVNEQELGRIFEFALQRRWITGVSFQPTTYTGRYFLPNGEDRVTFPEILSRLEQQTKGNIQQNDFTPLPCAHPNAHTIGYVCRFSDEKGNVRPLPLSRFVDLKKHLELLSGRITFDRARTKRLVQTYLESLNCGCTDADAMEVLASALASDDDARTPFLFVNKALAKELAPEDMLRVTTTSFMDAYNFDVRQLMKSCVHHLLPSGHIIPFSAYNLFYRDGRVPLPKLSRTSCTVGTI